MDFRFVRGPVSYLNVLGDVLTTGGRMTDTQCFFSKDGPSQQRLIDLTFFRWRLGAHDKGTATFTVNGDVKIRVVIANVGPDKENRKGWVEILLFDEKETLGSHWLKCVYNTITRDGLIEVTIVAVESQATTH